MKHTVIIGFIVFVAFFAISLHAEQEVNFLCKNDCITRGNTIGYCNDLCSTTDASGNVTKDMGCVSKCTANGGTYFNCYSQCPAQGQKAGQPSADLQGTSEGTQKALH